MLRFKFAIVLVASLTFVAGQFLAAGAQNSPESSKSFLQSAEAMIVQNIGAPVDAVELSIEGPIITTLRINSNLNESSHSGRNNEALAIASVVTKALAGNPEYKGITVIHVDYVTRQGPDTAVKLIDSIEFRKNQTGVFEIHLT